MDENSFWGGFASKIKIYHIVTAFMISALAFIISFVSFQDSLKKIEKCTAEVNGIVTKVDVDRRYRSMKSEDNRESYTITTYISVETDNVFKKETISDQTISYSNHATQYTKGEIVTIHYNPNNPNSYYINDNTEEHGGFSVIGIFFFILGAVLTILYRINKKQQDFYY